MQELEKILNTNEKVIWTGKPRFLPYLLSGSFYLFIIGLFWTAISVPTIITILNSQRALSSYSVSPLGTSPLLILATLPHLWIGLALLFGPLLYRIFVYKHLLYAITDKRVLYQGGIIGRDFEMLDFDQITNAEVNVGVWDMWLAQGKTGSIKVFSAGTVTRTKNGYVATPYILANIEDPYEVFKLLKGVSMDVKTDIQYPNKLRPDENPGYNTKYSKEN